MVRLLSALVIIFFFVSIAGFLVGGDELEAWTEARLAEPGSRAAAALLIFALLAGDIVLPVPSSLTALAAGAIFGAVGGTLIAGAGLTLGALLGLVGARRVARARVRARLGPGDFARLEATLQRHAPLIVLLSRPVPVLAETSVLVAGACGARVSLLAGPIVFGSFAMSAGYAWLGAQAHDRSTFLIVFAMSCVIPGAFWLLLRRLRR